MYLDIKKALDILSGESVQEICKITKCRSKDEIYEKIEITRKETLKYSDILGIDIENIDRRCNVDLWLDFISTLFILIKDAYKVKFNNREEMVFDELKLQIKKLKYKVYQEEMDTINEIISVYRNFIHLTTVIASGKNSDYVGFNSDVVSLLYLQSQVVSVIPDMLDNNVKAAKKVAGGAILKVMGIGAATMLVPGIGGILLGLGATKLVLDKTKNKMDKQAQCDSRFTKGLLNMFDFGFEFSLLVQYIRSEQEKFDEYYSESKM